MSAKCPKCSFEVSVARKSWVMKPRRAKDPTLKTTLYTCPKCGKSFRTYEVVKG